MEFLSGFIESINISGIYYEYKTLCAGIIMPPKWTNLILSTDILANKTKFFRCHQLQTVGQMSRHQIPSQVKGDKVHQTTYPYRHAELFEGDRFDIETNGRNRRHGVTIQLQLVQNRCKYKTFRNSNF